MAAFDYDSPASRRAAPLPPTTRHDSPQMYDAGHVAHVAARDLAGFDGERTGHQARQCANPASSRRQNRWPGTPPRTTGLPFSGRRTTRYRPRRSSVANSRRPWSGSSPRAPATLRRRSRVERLVFLHRLGNEEIVECLHAETGATNWQFRYPTEFRRSVRLQQRPSIEPGHRRPGRVYTVGAQGAAALPRPRNREADLEARPGTGVSRPSGFFRRRVDAAD